ncbi:MAG TPA: hypothetical protein VMO47_12355 [Rhodothermales bacterium]|nr:hypothetical protein [Rhodothermales bacterium]
MTQARPESAESDPGSASVLFAALRILGFVALVLMLASIIYAGWIALDNWGDIRV